ncbi:NlpE N-terminal domain-containing protein [Arsukibacterium tuosuense]|uniref:NlpE N-terminal domain-containing protein n=1 Tax=Arsukibacterium tuosuense TaxID=1323745 RepID=A0A285JL62_9GAMM|nr:META domain-containing protein [Arsukibacterium tuosuense]SNY60793.1 NlpE N-terminal domain-containing protein [Arsukibacterium tuosuense]
MRYSFSLFGSTVFCSVLSLGMLTGCQPEATSPTNEPVQQQSPTPADTSQNALDWPGSYQGVIPCADCPGIKMTLQLDANQGYQLTRYYQERADEPEQTEGEFRWSSDGRQIQLDDAAGSQFLVGENRLLMLNPQGERISGELAAQYWLDKQQDTAAQSADNGLNIAGKWQLTELLQKAVDADNKVFLQFDNAGRVSGYTGCNRLTGGYQLQGPKLSFTPLATTRMACLQETIEPQLLDVLSKVDNISIAGDELSLNRARMAPLARFTRLPENADE